MIDFKGRKFRKDPLDVMRRQAWARSRSQAEYYDQDWQLTYEEFCEFFPDLESFQRRGKGTEDLTLCRYDPEGAWSADNCCLITRYNHLCAKIARRHGKPTDQFFNEAVWIR